MWSIGLSCLAASLGAAIIWRRHSIRTSLPPLPPGHWFWGNMHWLQGPTNALLLGTTIRQQYGDIIALITPFETVIVVNTIGLANELLDQQAAVTSTRPNKVMLDQIMDWGKGVAWQKENERHRKLRRIMAATLNPPAARKYTQEHHEATMKILKQFSKNPPSLLDTAHLVLGSFFMRIAYGYVTVDNDPLIQLAHQALGYFIQGYLFHFWVNDIPILRFLPSWFPGAGFQKIGLAGQSLRTRYVNEPFDDVLDQIRRGHVEHPSYASRLLEEKGGINASPEDLDLIKWSTGAIFGGGASPSLGILSTHLIMMALYPEIARKAQSEIDQITGRERLPNLDDMDHMPYFGALLQEVMRTFPPASLGVPHCASQDIRFHGYLIPQGAAIYPNIWGMMHDEEKYELPYTFNPERFLGANPEPDPSKYIFGFGRRICPGLHVGTNGMWLICAAILAVFDIEPVEELLAQVKSVGGRDSKDMFKVIGGYASRGRNGPCKLTARDSIAASLINDS